MCVCVGVRACGMIAPNGQNPMAEDIWKLIKSLKVGEGRMFAKCSVPDEYLRPVDLARFAVCTFMRCGYYMSQ